LTSCFHAGGAGFAIGGTDGTPYTFENRKATAATIPWMMNPNPLRTANLRAPYAQGRCFACESQMDEMAAAASMDPVEFRLRYLGDNRRAADVLRAAANRAGWQARPSRAVGGTGGASGNVAKGRGVAISGMAGTVVAQVADVEVDKSKASNFIQKRIRR
jgi:nicotinate dehydrogenase subunit B